MRLLELRLRNLRNIGELSLFPSAGINLLLGPNGAGKTSILEGIYLLSHAHSFRTRRGDFLVRYGAGPLCVFGAVEKTGATANLGLQWEDKRWLARIGGAPAEPLSTMLEHCAVVCFDPGAHALVSGASEERRRFVDWGVFHVEHKFIGTLRRYRRVLRQRNAALRENASDRELSAWDQEMILAAVPVVEARAAYLARFGAILKPLVSSYLPELGAADIKIRDGWPQGVDAADALVECRHLDRQRGHTTRGPHRADWSLSFEGAPRHQQLSRGQEKLCAIACMIAQAELYRDDRGEWPIVLLDDLPSELDLPHQDAALASLSRAAQVFLTSTQEPSVLLQRAGRDYQRFHVEQGQIRSLV